MPARHCLRVAALIVACSCSPPGPGPGGDPGPLHLVGSGELSVDVGFERVRPPYLVPAAAGVVVRALFNASDSVNTRPDGSSYRMAGLPDGLGAIENGDGTLTLLSN